MQVEGSTTANIAACLSSKRRCRTSATRFDRCASTPAFSLVAIATLAVGIGAGTAVFSFVRAVLLRPLPYTQAERTGAHLRDQSAEELDTEHRRARQLGGLASAQPGFHGHRGLRTVQAGRQRRQRSVPDRLRRAAGAEVDSAYRQLLFGSRRGADARPCFHRRRNVRRKGTGRHPELRPVAERVRRRPGRRSGGRSPSAAAVTTSWASCRRRSSSRAATFSCGCPSATRADMITKTRRPHFLGAIARMKPGVASRAREAGHGPHRQGARGGISRHEHANGRPPRTAPRQLRQRTADGAADAERRGRSALSHRLREHRQPSARVGR